jgi:hypothetical protein
LSPPSNSEAKRNTKQNGEYMNIISLSFASIHQS